MLYKNKALKGFKMHSLDGEIGQVREFYFDDQYWTIRYLVADTGNWLTGRQVLISPYALTSVNNEGECIIINLTKKQIEHSPALESHIPVSQQFEQMYYGYYGWPLYWGGPYMWGNFPYIVRNSEQWKKSAQSKKVWDSHLRSTHSVSGYDIQALDGDIGHVEDFIIDDETWAIRYLIVDTKNWWPGNKVLISTKWIKRVSWSESKVIVSLSRESIMKSPVYTADSLLTRNYENTLHKHYNLHGYWIDEPSLEEEFHNIK
jgi:hypothetical protein